MPQRIRKAHTPATGTSAHRGSLFESDLRGRVDHLNASGVVRHDVSGDIDIGGHVGRGDILRGRARSSEPEAAF